MALTEVETTLADLTTVVHRFDGELLDAIRSVHGWLRLGQLVDAGRIGEVIAVRFAVVEP